MAKRTQNQAQIGTILSVTTVMYPRRSWKWQDRCAVRVVEHPVGGGTDLRYRGVRVRAESPDLGFGTRRHMEMEDHYLREVLPRVLRERARCVGLEGMVDLPEVR